jgi:hypothetical protein
MRAILPKLTLAAALWLLVLANGCGPIRATSATSGAKDHLFKAELAGADKLTQGEKYITPAQYEYQLAMLYIEKSKELQGFAKYDAAFFYSTEAADLGKKAVEHKSEEERRKIRRQQIRAGKVFKQ